MTAADDSKKQRAEEKTPGWITLNVRVGYSPLSWLQVHLSLKNLTDKRYKYHGSGIYAPGFNLLAGLSLTY